MRRPTGNRIRIGNRLRTIRQARRRGNAPHRVRRTPKSDAQPTRRPLGVLTMADDPTHAVTRHRTDRRTRPTTTSTPLVAAGRRSENGRTRADLRAKSKTQTTRRHSGRIADAPATHNDGPRNGGPPHQHSSPIHRTGSPVHRIGSPVHRIGSPVHRIGSPRTTLRAIRRYRRARLRRLLRQLLQRRRRHRPGHLLRRMSPHRPRSQRNHPPPTHRCSVTTWRTTHRRVHVPTWFLPTR